MHSTVLKKYNIKYQKKNNSPFDFVQQYNKNRRNMKTIISLKIIRTTNEELSGSSISVVKKKKKAH